MSTPDNRAEDHTGTNDEWFDAETNYSAGMIYEGSMFEPVRRDEKIWGILDPLDEVPPDPYDDEGGDDAWCKSHRGTHVYTGEAIMHTNRPPTTEQQKRRTQFWEQWDTQRLQSTKANAQDQDQGQPAAGDEQHFPDVLPIPSGPNPQISPINITAQQSMLAAPAPDTAPVPSSHHSSEVDGQYESDADYLPDAPKGPTTTKDNDQEQLPNSTPPKTSSPRSVDDWDDANLLSLWKLKVIRKKGYEPMLLTFRDQSVESLREAWAKRKQRCQQLGESWKVAGKPESPLSEWFQE